MMVAISGELDTLNAHQLGQILCDIADGGDLILDLAEVRFIDSSGLRALVRVACATRDAGRSLRLVQVTSRTSKLIEIAGLAAVLTSTTQIENVGRMP
jgi:anti-anti-sigma factor